MDKLAWKRRIIRERRIQMVAFLLTMILIATMLLKVDNLLISFVLAFVISYLFSPIVNLLERKGFHRSFSIFGLFGLTSIILTLLIAALSPVLFGQISEFREVFPRYVRGLTDTINQVNKI